MGLWNGLINEMLADSDRLGIKPERVKSIQKLGGVLPAFVKGVDRYWGDRTSQRAQTSEDELRELYDLLAGSGINDRLAPYDQLRDALADPADAETALDADLVYRFGADANRFSPRVAGTRGMDAASEHFAELLREFGVPDVWEEPLNFRGVFFHKWSFETLGENGESFTVFPEDNVGFGDVTADLVWVGKGDSEAAYEGVDVNGKIALIDFGDIDEEMHSDLVKERNRILQLYDRAYVHGAAALIGYFSDAPGNVLKVIEPGIRPVGGSNVWGPGESGADGAQQLPVLNIGQQDALRLKAQLEQGRVRAHLVIEGVRKVSTTKIVAGILPGLTDELISVGCHSDTAFAGAVCDTSGVAGTLALAKHFAALPVSRRPKSILFYFDSFHVWGNCCQVANTLLSRHPTLAANITAALWLDHFSDGRFDTDGVALINNNPVYWPLLALALARRGIKPNVLPVADLYSICTTGAHQRRGIPTMTIQKVNGDLLSTEDTWSKFDPEAFYRDVLAHIDFLEAVQHLNVPQEPAEDPVTGCGVLFHSLDTPSYPEGESYVPEATYPLYVGGTDGAVRIYTDQRDKDAYRGQA